MLQVGMTNRSGVGRMPSLLMSRTPERHTETAAIVSHSVVLCVPHFNKFNNVHRELHTLLLWETRYDPSLDRGFHDGQVSTSISVFSKEPQPSISTTYMKYMVGLAHSWGPIVISTAYFNTKQAL